MEIQTKYYNASNNFSAPIKREPKPYSPQKTHNEVVFKEPQNLPPVKMPEEEIENTHPITAPAREFSLKTDDLLLIGLIILLLPDIENNLLLVLILGYLLITGMGGG